MSELNLKDIKMKPKVYFVLKAIMWGVLTSISFFLVLFLTSAIMFSIRFSGLIYMPKFGAKGMLIFLSRLPWTLMLFSFIALIISMLLIKKVDYKKPIIYSLVGLIILSFVGGLLIDKSNIHPRIIKHQRNMYMIPKHPDMRCGRVFELHNNGFLLNSKRGESVNVIIEKEMKMIPKGPILIDDHIVIFGKGDNEAFYAKGIKRVK